MYIQLVFYEINEVEGADDENGPKRRETRSFGP